MAMKLIGIKSSTNTTLIYLFIPFSASEDTFLNHTIFLKKNETLHQQQK